MHHAVAEAWWESRVFLARCGHGATESVGPIAIGPNHDVLPLIYPAPPSSADQSTMSWYETLTSAPVLLAIAVGISAILYVLQANPQPREHWVKQQQEAARAAAGSGSAGSGKQATETKDPKAKLAESIVSPLPISHSTTRHTSTQDKQLTMTQSVMSAPAVDLAPPKVSSVVVVAWRRKSENHLHRSNIAPFSVLARQPLFSALLRLRRTNKHGERWMANANEKSFNDRAVQLTPGRPDLCRRAEAV